MVLFHWSGKGGEKPAHWVCVLGFVTCETRDGRDGSLLNSYTDIEHPSRFFPINVDNFSSARQ